jgi:hypothetical protein
VICDFEWWHWQVGVDSTCEIQCLDLQGENPRSDLNWLCLAMILLKALFCECGPSLR